MSNKENEYLTEKDKKYREFLKKAEDEEFKRVLTVKEELEKYRLEKMGDAEYYVVMHALSRMIPSEPYESDGEIYCPRCATSLSTIYVKSSVPVIGCPFCLQRLKGPVKVKRLVRKVQHTEEDF